MVSIKKSEINREAYILVEQVYGNYLRENTFLGALDQKKNLIINQWSIKPIDFLVFEFENPNFFDIKIQEEGLEPQIIRAKNKKFMRFKKPDSRKSPYEKIPGNIAFESQGYIYAKAIRHPGFEGRRFIQNMLLDDGLFKQFSDGLAISIDRIIEQKTKEINDEIAKY